MDHEELLQLSHKHINAYIKVADQKASILLSGQLAFFALSANFVPSEWNNFGINVKASIILTVILALGGVLFSILTVTPQEETQGRAGYILWKDILEHKNEDQFVENTKALTEDDVIQSLGEEVYKISKVADQKYDNLRISIYLTGAFLLMGIFAAVLHLC